MTEKELKKIYYFGVMPRILIGTLNSLVSFGLATFLLVIGIERCTAGVYLAEVHLPIAPFVLNERQEGPDKAAGQKAWQADFEKYARKITIANADSVHRLDLILTALPKNDPPHVELSFEVYDSDKDYLFSFYADDYWHQDGYDDGYWQYTIFC
jgi:hypothetical protein